MSLFGFNFHNTYLRTKLIKIAYKFCYCSNKSKEQNLKLNEKLKKKKTLKTQGKNSKLKGKTQFFGIFRILQCEKDVPKKPVVITDLHLIFSVFSILST